MSFSKQGIAIAGLGHSYFEIFFDLNCTHSERDGMSQAYEQRKNSIQCSNCHFMRPLSTEYLPTLLPEVHHQPTLDTPGSGAPEAFRLSYQH